MSVPVHIRPRIRTRYVQEMLKEGYDVLSSDADVAWMRDPRPYFGKLIGLHPVRDDAMR